MAADILREMLISHDIHETRVAVLEDRRLVELYLERPKRSVVGNVYLGVVRDVLPGMQAAFVDIGLEKNAFLGLDEIIGPDGVKGTMKAEIQSFVKPGQKLMVQVLKDPMGTKGARLTMDITLPGRYVVLMPFSSVVGISRKLAEEERDASPASWRRSCPRDSAPSCEPPLREAAPASSRRISTSCCACGAESRRRPAKDSPPRWSTRNGSRAADRAGRLRRRVPRARGG